MKDLWNKNPAAWNAMSLAEKIEAMRIWHCTGPCGQSSSVMGTRSALDDVLRKAVKDIESGNSVINNAVDVIRKASVGDQNFIECLRGDDPNTVSLRHAIVDLIDALKET